jgi:Flp pilus assembly protein TadG
MSVIFSRLRHPSLTRLWRNRRGVAAVELALVALPMMMVIMVFFDFGHRMYVDSALQGALQDAARQATIGDRTSAQVDQIVYDQMSPLMKPSNIAIVRKSYRQFAGVGKPETLVDDKNGNGKYDLHDCWTDTNPNGFFDTDSGASGMGEADDVFLYQVTVTYDRIVPLFNMLGWSNTVTTTMRTMMRNQPYAGRGSPAKVCS